MHQAGGFPVIATCGTALTSQQAQMLRRFAAKAVLCYDADRAGQTAAERSSELLVSEGFDVNVVQLPGGEDPDTFIQKQGRDAFVAQLKRSRPYLEYLLDRAAAEHDLTRDDSRREFLSRMLGVAARIPDPAVARSVRRPSRPQGEGHGSRRSSRNQESGRRAEDGAAGRAGADPPGPHPKGGKRADLDAGPSARRGGRGAAVDWKLMT